MKERDGIIEKYVSSIEFIREKLLSMDDLINPVMGIRNWDDSVVVEFGGKKLVVSADGPYSKRLVLKSALIHAATDVVVKGGRPLFALDTLIGSRDDVGEMVSSLERQAREMSIPILGGNTLFEEVEPRCSLTVVGELVIDEPIRDSTTQDGDVIALVGEPIWGEQEERFPKAKKLFETWFSILDSEVKINAAKDVTKGGLAAVVYEMQSKSGRKFELKDKIEYPVTRNLDNFIVTLAEKEYEKLTEICSENNCPLVEIGGVA